MKNERPSNFVPIFAAPQEDGNSQDKDKKPIVYIKAQDYYRSSWIKKSNESKKKFQ